MSIAAPAAMNIGTTSTTPAHAPATRLRITARGRRVLAGLVAAPIVAVLAALALFAGGNAVASAGSSAVEFDYLTVQAGQSLWSIAEELAPTADPRDVIAEIRSLNQLSTSSVQPGQRIAVPADLAE